MFRLLPLRFSAILFLIFSSLAIGMYYVLAQTPIQQSVNQEDLDLELLEKWSRAAEYDSIMQYLYPRYEVWKKTDPLNIAKSIKYMVNSTSATNPEKVEQILDEMESLISKRLGKDDLSLHFIYHQRALDWLNKGLWDEAKSMIEASAQVHSIGQQFPKLFSDINSVASFLAMQYGELENGLRYNDIADSILILHYGEQFFGRIATLNNYGILYESLGRHHDALEAGLKTVHLVKEHYSENHENLPKALNGLGLKYYALGRTDEAIETFKEALAWNVEYKRDVNQFDLYLNLSSAYAGKWDYDNALSFLDLANSYLIEGVDFYPPHKVELLMRKASLKMDLGNTLEANQHISEIKELLRIGFDTDDFRLRKTYAMFFMFEIRHKNFEEATNSLEKYLQIINAYLGSENEEWAHGLAWKAELYEATGKLDSALFYNNLALDLYHKILGNQHHYYIETQLQLISTLIGLEKKNSADSILNKILLLGFDENLKDQQFSLPPYAEIYKHIHLRGVLENKLTVTNCANFDSKKSCLLEQASLYKYLGYEFDRVLQQYGGYKSRDDLRAGSAQIFKKAILNCYELYEETGDAMWKDLALEYAERTRGLRLQEIMRDKMAKVGGGIPDSLRMVETELLLYKSNLEEQLQSVSDQENSEIYAAIRNELASLEVKYSAFIQRLEREYPRYFDLKYSVERADVANIREHMLKNGKGMIQFSFLDEQVFVHILDSKTNELLKINLPADLDEVVGHYYQSLQNRDYQQLNQYGSILYGIIIEPIMPYIDHMTELVIVPDSWLYYLSLESLPMPEYPGGFLIERFNIQYSYSPTVAIQNKKYKKSRKTLLDWVGFVPGFEEKDLPDAELKFVAQPFASRIADSVALQFNGQLFKGKNANRQTFTESAGKGRLLHVGTHAVADDSDPMNSYMVLSGEEPAYDLLKASEIFNKEINSNCAILTACQTAMGKLKSGEGMVSLARAFAYAGCPNMVVTLWSVDDQQTASIISGFYREVKKGQRLDNALYKAKLSYLENARGELKHPFYWAGLVYFGTDSYINESNYSWLWYLLGLSVFALIIYFLRIRQKNQTAPIFE